MVRGLVVLSVVLVAAYAATLPLNFQQLPEQLKEVVPEAVTKFYAELTDEDKKILKEIAANHAQYENEDQALEALKAKSEKLYNKATELRKLLKDKIDSLNPEAKAFVEDIIAKLRALKPKTGEKPDLKKIREIAQTVIGAYQKLSDDAKTNLQATFPNITNVIKNEKFQQVAKGLIKTEN
ncbi:unnamed protein product [Bursaphelenchus okinawaensis]|uniref:Fatty-acid and retinol-binding protein 1 n=1 Tax=Bursaphelenchus okinawaensis TaxID=465554 RepID=A0A811KK44_9BILA|nr:unnamed protein product [Bursaphelenchus okinawaensis]CAG9104534.1 unnamed protein product [Bursaphelenchus okinawaensis]